MKKLEHHNERMDLGTEYQSTAANTEKQDIRWLLIRRLNTCSLTKDLLI